MNPLCHWSTWTMGFSLCLVGTTIHRTLGVPEMYGGLIWGLGMFLMGIWCGTRIAPSLAEGDRV
jgi:hypothetical protein